MVWKRVECHGDDSSLTLWKHPGTKTLSWSSCVGNCGFLLSSGTNICWNPRCQTPLTEAGYNDMIRMNSVNGDTRGIRRIQSLFGRGVTVSQKRREAATVEATRVANPKAKSSVQLGLRSAIRPAHQGTKPAKLLAIAKAARREKHVLYEGTDEEWCYYSHKERYDNDAECVEQMKEFKRCGEDGILWFQGTNNDTGERAQWLDADAEVQKANDRAAGLIPAAKVVPTRKDSRTNNWFQPGSYSGWK